MNLRKACPYCPRSAVCLGSNALQMGFKMEVDAVACTFVVECTTLDPTRPVPRMHSIATNGRTFWHQTPELREVTVKFTVPNEAEIREEFRNDKIQV